MARQPRKPGKIPVDKNLLTDIQKQELDKEAHASVAEEMKQAARDAYFADKIASIRRAKIPTERFVNVTIDTAPYVPHLMIDGDMYFNGYSYDVEASRAAVLWEQMQRSWQHQDEIDGRRKSEAYRRPQNRVIGPREQGLPTIGFSGNRAVELPANTEI